MLQKIDRYEIHKEIGRGAMGIVYMGYDPNISRTVAIKTLRMDLFSGDEKDEFLIRFKREAQTAGRLSHQNIVTIYDLGEDSNSNNLYIIMEFISGKNLKEILSDSREIDSKTAVSILSQIADGLDYAHKNGIIHRDIKPANIIITANKQVKITDFGIAKVSGTEFTQTGKSLGTPSYMSPEQVLGKDVTSKSDLFSFGALSYEVLTGEKAFKGNNITSIVYKILNEKPALPESNILSQNQRLIKAITRAMDRDPSKRYNSASEFVSDIKTALLTREPAVTGSIEKKEDMSLHMHSQNATETEPHDETLPASKEAFIPEEDVTQKASPSADSPTLLTRHSDSADRGSKRDRTIKHDPARSATIPVKKSASEPQHKSKALLIFAVILAIVFILGLSGTAGYFLIDRYLSSGKEKPAQTAEVSETTEDASRTEPYTDITDPAVSIIDDTELSEESDPGSLFDRLFAGKEQGEQESSELAREMVTQTDEENDISTGDMISSAQKDTLTHPGDKGIISKPDDQDTDAPLALSPGTDPAEDPLSPAVKDDILKPAPVTSTQPKIPNRTFHAIKKNISYYGIIGKELEKFRRPRGFTIVGNNIYIAEDPLGRGDPILVTDINDSSSYDIFNTERLDTPSDIKLNKRGVVDIFIVTDTNNGNIKFFDKQGNLLSYIEGDHKKPFFIVSDIKEQIFYVTDFSTGHIYKYDSRGSLLSKSRNPLKKPMGIAMHADIIYVVDNSTLKVHTFRPNLSEIGSFQIPSDIAKSPIGIRVYNDILLITDESKRILIGMALKGDFLGTIDLDNLKSPYYLEIHGNKLFISDNSEGYIYIYEN